MLPKAVAAVDLGATSGRVMLGHVGHNELSVRPVARFPNGPVSREDGLHWDIDALYSSVLAGLAAAVREEPQLSSIGVDSWAVDYALMEGGRMIAPPFHYRDERTAAGVERVHAIADHAELYASNGLQFLPFNTLYQFAAEQNLAGADSFLLVPDLINYWLTGRQVAEQTNASTTGLLNLATGQWDDALIEKLGFSRTLFPELVTPGTTLGPVRDEFGIRADVVAGAHRGKPGRELHERGRCRRAGALPAQHHGLVVAERVRARMAEG